VEYLFGPGKRNQHTHQRVVAAYDDELLGPHPGEFDRARVAAELDYPRRWALEAGFSERHLEDALVARLTNFLAELAEGFEFVGRQYRLTVDDQDFFADLLFFHLGLRRYIVFELKVGPAAPEHLGQLNFYVNVIDDLMRRPEHDDGPTIGILLAATRNDVVVEYALRSLGTPLAVSTYRTTAALRTMFAAPSRRWRTSPTSSVTRATNRPHPAEPSGRGPPHERPSQDIDRGHGSRYTPSAGRGSALFGVSRTIVYGLLRDGDLAQYFDECQTLTHVE